MTQALAIKLGEALKAHSLMLCTAESCTGGGVASAVTDIAGSSNWFDRGFVTYSNQAKQDMLGVSAETLMHHGAVSEATVREMVAGALQHSQSHIALAISGIAGPGGGTPDKPVGTVWFAWGMKDGEVVARHHLLPGDRSAVRAAAVEIALRGALELIEQRSVSA